MRRIAYAETQNRWFQGKLPDLPATFSKQLDRESITNRYTEQGQPLVCLTLCVGQLRGPAAIVNPESHGNLTCNFFVTAS